MWAAVIGPVSVPPVIVTVYWIVVVAPLVDEMKVADAVAVEVLGVGFSFAPFKVAVNVLVSGGPLGSSSSSSQPTAATVESASRAVRAKRTFMMQTSA